MGTDYPELELLVGDRWESTHGRAVLEVVNPATESAIGHLPLASTEDLDRAIDAARSAFLPWRSTPSQEKTAIFFRTAALLRERSAVIAQWLTAEQGKPLAEAVDEVNFAATLIEFFGSQALAPLGTILATGDYRRRQIVMPEPVGPVASFTPWNYPVVVPARKIAASLAAGCTTVVKPAEETPASSVALARAFRDAGLPSGVLNMVFGDPAQVAAHLIRSPAIRKVSFTGPTAIGKQIAALAAEGVKPCILELGGHTPVIVFDDVDVVRAAGLAVASKFHNGGQSCGSPSRFYVHVNVHDAFVEAFVRETEKLSVGDPLASGTDIGPLANKRRRASMVDLVADAVGRGAELVSGGSALNAVGYFFQPTVLSRVPEGARIMNEEPFGPVAATDTFSTIEEAVDKANRLPYGLGSYVWTKDAERANVMTRLIEAGMVGVNRFGLGGSETFFGGVKESGYGSEGGPEAVRDYQVRKLIDQE